MRKKLFTLYDKMIIAALVGIVGLMSCGRKNYPEKQTEQMETDYEQDPLKSTDTLQLPKERFDRVIAMYGVPPARNK